MEGNVFMSMQDDLVDRLMSLGVSTDADDDRVFCSMVAATVVREFFPTVAQVEDTLWGVLEPRLEDVIRLDLNVPSENVQFQELVRSVAEAIVSQRGVSDEEDGIV